ncbi:MAG: hypothetical protein P0S95_01165 [Rhabdochlamydiaceae bacterium]|nr:hypothetical protein [Candidatus Amphrikana amoebophyrae]
METATLLSKEYALQACLKIKSDQTNFLHFNREKPYGKNHDTIPLYHNFLYILSLLRSHQVDYMQEGMRILTHLLYFQNQGMFPNYIHNFPFVRQSPLQVDILAPIMIIYRDYGHLFSDELSNRLKLALIDILEACRQIPVLDTHSELKVNLFAYAYGILFDSEALFPLKSWNEIKVLGSHQLSDLLIFAQLLLKTPMEKEIKKILNLCEKSYHFATRNFSGIQSYELWNGASAKQTLFHHVMNLRHGLQLDEKSDNLMFLSLVDFASLPAVELNSQGDSFFNHMTKVSDCENPLQTIFNYSFATEKDFFHLTSYVGEFEFSSKMIEEGKLEAQFKITKEFDPQLCREPIIKLFISQPEKVKVLVEGKCATTFQANENVSLMMREEEVGLLFHSNNDQSHFLGKVCRSNRPAQVNATKFDAYDLEVAIRSVKWEVGDIITLMIQV